jgi:alpha-glucosidase
MKQFLYIILLIAIQGSLSAQYQTEIIIEKDEYWWGAAVGLGSTMPFKGNIALFDLSLQNKNNQVVPLLLSNRGRYLWSDSPFTFEVKNNQIIVKSAVEEPTIRKAGNTLKESYLAASKAHFPPSGILPDTLFFTMPQYNTWIELMYNQNQEDIMHYAQSIIKHDFPTGVIMIDDNWQKYYGNFEFKPDKFPDPRGMVEALHQMGFKVMLWVCPFVSADSPEYRELRDKGYLIRKKGNDSPAMIDWWNGFSACYDLTNPEAVAYFVSQLKKIQANFNIDGFKFDAGDNQFYNPDLIESHMKNARSVDHTMAWAKIGLQFPFNEYRAGYAMGGMPLVQRLGDKDYSWDAVKSLIPEMLTAGLLGYAYTCPDMIGGGQFTAFLGINDSEFNQELIVRSAQVHALMPMMQFSVAPWRILNKENLNIVRDAALLHQQFGKYILELAKESARTGEPVVRHMEYAFPHQGFATCNDQFMLGDKYLIAPVITESNIRTVKLPKGVWIDDQGKKYKGGKSIEVDIPLNRLLYFTHLR